MREGNCLRWPRRCRPTARIGMIKLERNPWLKSHISLLCHFAQPMRVLLFSRPMRDKTKEQMIAVAVRDEEDLFLWLRIRRARSGIYYMIPTGRTGPEWKKSDPHATAHQDGRSHRKSYD